MDARVEPGHDDMRTATPGLLLAGALRRRGEAEIELAGFQRILVIAPPPERTGEE